MGSSVSQNGSTRSRRGGAKRGSVKAVSVARSQALPWDCHREVEQAFCQIAGGVVAPLCPSIFSNLSPRNAEQTQYCPETIDEHNRHCYYPRIARLLVE